jgi:hypothetical protein
MDTITTIAIVLCVVAFVVFAIGKKPATDADGKPVLTSMWVLMLLGIAIVAAPYYLPLKSLSAAYIGCYAIACVGSTILFAKAARHAWAARRYGLWYKLLALANAVLVLVAINWVLTAGWVYVIESGKSATP